MFLLSYDEHCHKVQTEKGEIIDWSYREIVYFCMIEYVTLANQAFVSSGSQN